jgi:hypothetical protein
MDPAAAPKASVHVISKDHPALPNFWVGFFKQGTYKPSELYRLSTYEILERASNEGIAEDDTVMLVDGTGNSPKFLYLINQANLGEDGHEASEKIRKTLTSWKTPKIGIYLCPSLNREELFGDLLQDILTELISGLEIREYYLLTGRYGLNKLVNIAHELKASLESSGIVIDFFH